MLPSGTAPDSAPDSVPDPVPDPDAPALLVTAQASEAGEEDGVTFWRGFDPAAVPTGVFMARAHASAGTRIPMHWHSHDTVAYLVGGRARFRSGPDLQDVHDMEPGDWLFVPAGMVHVEETPDDSYGEFVYARDGGGGVTTYVSETNWPG